MSKLEQLKPYKLFINLPNESKEFIGKLATNMPFTFQELRILTTIETDLLMWEELTLKQIYNQFEVVNKQTFYKKVNKTWNELKSNTQYSGERTTQEKKNYSFKNIDSGEKIFGDCPVASEKTICCNLKTIDPIQNCGFDCNYCCIQSFYPENTVFLEDNLAEKLKNINLDKDKTYHFGTGQSSDSLMWGNKNGILNDLCNFAKDNSNIILELKTKSKNINHLLENKQNIPRNVICSWTLNTTTIIDEEEIGAASLKERLTAAKKIVDAGLLVAFHFHPMIYYKNWQKEYEQLFSEVINNFNPKDIAFISFGTLTYTKPTIQKIRLSKERSKILQMHLEDAAGKLSYPKKIKEDLFKFAYKNFKQWEDKTFFYLCMEERHYWETTFGRCYNSNGEFESDLANAVMSKIKANIIGQLTL